MAIPSIRPSRAVTAVDLSVLLNLGHHGGLGVARRLGMLISVTRNGDDCDYGTPTSERQKWRYRQISASRESRDTPDSADRNVYVGRLQGEEDALTHLTNASAADRHPGPAGKSRCARLGRSTCSR
jgi:hypothetical protein